MLRAYHAAAKEYSETHIFTADDVCILHNLCFDTIYEWAGTYRNVDLMSGDIRWCHAMYIQQEMTRFTSLLSEWTPFKPGLHRLEVVEQLVRIHGDLILIHPFRDGNGRVTRLLCDLLLMQSNRKPLEQRWHAIQDIQKRYYAAIRDIWVKADYTNLMVLFENLMEVD